MVLLLQQYGLHLLTLLYGVVITAIWTVLVNITVWCCYYSNMDCAC